MMNDRIKQALDRIARTPDGQEFYRYLQQVVCQTHPNVSDGALRQHEGTRIFASDLMTHMGEGIDASVRRDGNEQPVILKRSGDGNQPKHRQSVREYLANQPGWYDREPDDDPDAGSGAT